MDSCDLMGGRVFYENLMANDYQQRIFNIYEPYDIGTKLEFVKYLNSMDDRPANLGGRNNGWRVLEIGAFSTQSVLMNRSKRRKESLSKAKNYKMSRNERSRFQSKPIPKSESPKKKSKSPSRKNELDFEDDIGMLFEWTSQLSVDNLLDYTLA
jgi:hypothetical protein